MNRIKTGLLLLTIIILGVIIGHITMKELNQPKHFTISNK